MVTYLNIEPTREVETNYQGQPASSGTNTLVAAQGIGLSIRVKSYALEATGTVVAQFKDTDGTELGPAWSFQAREGISRTAADGHHLFATPANKGLNLILNGAVGVNVELSYDIG